VSTENYIEVVVESLAVIVALFAIWPAHKPRQQPTSNSSNISNIGNCNNK